MTCQDVRTNAEGLPPPRGVSAAEGPIRRPRKDPGRTHFGVITDGHSTKTAFITKKKTNRMWCIQAARVFSVTTTTSKARRCTGTDAALSQEMTRATPARVRCLETVFNIVSPVFFHLHIRRPIYSCEPSNIRVRVPLLFTRQLHNSKIDRKL